MHDKVMIVIDFQFIGSKDGVAIGSACSPGGSYSSVLNWLNDHSEQKIQFPRKSDIISFFDNNQVSFLLFCLLIDVSYKTGTDWYISFTVL
jgi:hypothetical protein